jgi:hypothetical protein
MHVSLKCVISLCMILEIYSLDGLLFRKFHTLFLNMDSRLCLFVMLSMLTTLLIFNLVDLIWDSMSKFVFVLIQHS